jgi:hypothetical protein
VEQALKQSFALNIEMMGLEALKKLLNEPSAWAAGGLVYLNSNGFEPQFMYESARFKNMRYISSLADQHAQVGAFVQAQFATKAVPRYLLLLPEHLRGESAVVPVYREYGQVYDYLKFLEMPRLSGSNLGHFCQFGAAGEEEQASLCFIVSGKDRVEAGQTLQKLLGPDLKGKLAEPSRKVEKVDRVVVGLVDEEEQVYYRQFLERVDSGRLHGVNSILAYFGEAKKAVVYDAGTNLQDFIDGCLVQELEGREVYVSDSFARVDSLEGLLLEEGFGVGWVSGADLDGGALPAGRAALGGAVGWRHLAAVLPAEGRAAGAPLAAGHSHLLPVLRGVQAVQPPQTSLQAV